MKRMLMMIGSESRKEPKLGTRRSFVTGRNMVYGYSYTTKLVMERDVEENEAYEQANDQTAL